MADVFFILGEILDTVVDLAADLAKESAADDTESAASALAAGDLETAAEDTQAAAAWSDAKVQVTAAGASVDLYIEGVKSAVNQDTPAEAAAEIAFAAAGVAFAVAFAPEISALSAGTVALIGLGSGNILSATALTALGLGLDYLATYFGETATKTLADFIGDVASFLDTEATNTGWFAGLQSEAESILDPTASATNYLNSLSPELAAEVSSEAEYYNLPLTSSFLPVNNYILGNGIVSGFTNFPTVTYVIGSNTGENIPTSGIIGQAVIVGGTGNDTVLAPVEGNDLIDGGDGSNTLDLSDVGGNLTITSVPNSSGAQELIIKSTIVGFHESLERIIYAYNFSKIILNNGNDTVSLSESDVPGLQDIDTGNGNDTIESSVTNLSIDFGDGANDTLLHAGKGSVVESGAGSDTFNISNDVLITGATPQDRIAFDGSDVYGALAWNSAQGGWAYNDYAGGVGYGLNHSGDLVIKTPGANPELMYIANYVGGPGVPTSEDTADIFVGIASEHAYRLLGPHPNVDFVWSQFNLANAMFKVDTGYSFWKGADPLVLDLTGNGLDLIGESEVSPMFDIWGDDFAVHTGWTKPDDGMLVWDNNGTYQLLGTNGASGFAALAAAAGIALGTAGEPSDPANNTLTASNPIFSQLYVWQDANGDGVMEPGELTSLSGLNIASISLNATPQTGDVVAGNYVDATSFQLPTNPNSLDFGPIARRESRVILCPAPIWERVRWTRMGLHGLTTR